MSTRTARILLWLALLLLAPLPYISVVDGLVPPLRMLLLGGLATAVWLQDPDYLSLLIGGSLLLEGLAWSGLLYLLARSVARRLAAFPPAARALVVAGVTAALLALAWQPIYRMPLSSRGLHGNIVSIFT